MRGGTQPLVTRPPYGEDRPATPDGDEHIGESKLPDGGGPSAKGLPLSGDIPGTSTLNKDENHVRDFDEANDDSIYRVDHADDLLTEGGAPEIRDDNANKHDSIGAWGKGQWEGSKTKYPYRDGIPNTMNASTQYVLARRELDDAPTRRIEPGKRIKIALPLNSITDGLNPDVLVRSKQCVVKLKRVDVRNLRWIFAVDCGNGARVVRIKAERSGRATKLSKMELDLTCSCPAWRWQGPEHHSKRQEYLDGKPRGTATVPVIRDPRNINRVCKHVASVLDHVQKWTVGKEK